MDVIEQRAGYEHDGHFAFEAGAGRERVLAVMPEVSESELREAAARLVLGWEMTVPERTQTCLPERLKKLEARLGRRIEQAKNNASEGLFQEVLRSRRLLRAVLEESRTEMKALEKLPHVHIAREGVLPRVVNLAEEYLRVTQGVWSEASLRVFVSEVQAQHALLMNEVLMLPAALKLAGVGYVLDLAEEPGNASGLATAVFSLERLTQFEWGVLLESLIVFDATLRDDPGGIFARMDAETRESYRKEVARLASHADFNERETAAAVVEMARATQKTGQSDSRMAQRMEHIGYFLFAEGAKELKHTIGYHAPWRERLEGWIRQFNDDVYLIGIMLVAALLIVPMIGPKVPHQEFWLVVVTLLLALIPVSQGAVDAINALVQSVLTPRALPKLDYTKGVPADAATLVVVPTLLLHEAQVKDLFGDLEARYLSNEDPNIHFALLTDLPDTRAQPPADEEQPLVQMARQYIENLNDKYAQARGGRFFLLHRHRVFNRRQGVWMGWERKRGKLLDLNKLLLKSYDSFPIKAGPLWVLDDIRYVITLDSDTRLPHNAARRMIGTIHHPLNRAIVNPRLGIVTVGYGLLQPRVGVSVQSASRSRLAAIYSGETGFDIYTRAVSDVYQDLFGEGIFTGKGIYEVAVLNQVLEKRFPRNALLSHDLIEGAYVRAGLVSDVEVIDDYPSQYHAHTRRKHRWIRGDWQILRWLFSPVPDETGRLVPNPISLISKWKILDNLRRSLWEPATLLLLICGWFFLPGGALYWTLITVGLMLLPGQVQLAIDLLKALVGWNGLALRAGLVTFASAIAVAGLNLTFLVHQTMLSLDAIVRSINRSYFSGRHLLEWETAAEAETSRRRTTVDLYLALSPLVAVLLAAALALRHAKNLAAAAPVLVLWAAAPLVARWLNSPPRADEGALPKEDRAFLEEQALRIWRFYADFAGEENHWLVPDHVEERGLAQVKLLTPTNLGMLLNGRLAAYELGFVTLEELVQTTLRSLRSYDRLERHRGHLFNWYDLVTLQAIHPVEVSTVDSGNLAAALYTLRAAGLELMTRPVIEIARLGVLEPQGNSFAPTGAATLRERVRALVGQTGEPGESAVGSEFSVWVEEERRRRRWAEAELVRTYTPWLLPEFDALVEVSAAMREVPPLADTESFLAGMRAVLRAVDDSRRELASELLCRMDAALERTTALRRDLQRMSDWAERLAEEMDFGFLFVESRVLLANGYDVERGRLHSTCFDLLATEARTAAFLAVAKGQIPQQSWFRLDRSHALMKGRAVLLSWTATMFEHLMPTLWMRSYPDTLLTNSLSTVVEVQMDHVRRIPWGISESGFVGEDEGGNYAYKAFGIPSIALKDTADDGPVIAPYATYLALPLKPHAAMANLRSMAEQGWVGEYGLYEAADYIGREHAGEPRLVRSWMAHHQGMSLVAVTNALRDNVFQRWFHANPRVRAAEQLLHEKPLSREGKSKLEQAAAVPVARRAS